VMVMVCMDTSSKETTIESGEMLKLFWSVPALEVAERPSSPAAGSGRDAGADAGGSQVQRCVGQPSTAGAAPLRVPAAVETLLRCDMPAKCIPEITVLRSLHDGSRALEFYFACPNFFRHCVVKRTQQGEPQLRFAQLAEEVRKATARDVEVKSLLRLLEYSK